MVPADRSTLRKQLRRRRQSLSPSQQRQASRQLAKTISHRGLLRKHRHIAFYWPNDGEIDPSLALTLAHQRHRHCYLPVLNADNSLRFIRYRPGDKLKNNRFGIPEPVNRQQARKPWALDLVFLPLVGFDRQGGRLGMGGGFYDRTFKAKRLNPNLAATRLIGLAHQCQEVDVLTIESWDVPLSAIVTDREHIEVRGNY